MFEFIIKLIISAIILAITAFFIPGFHIANITVLILAAIIIAALDYFISRVLNLEASPFGKGVVGFLITAGIIYVPKYIVSGYEIGIIQALIAALIYGILSAIIPGKAFFEKD